MNLNGGRKMSQVYQSEAAPQFPLPFSHAVRTGDYVFISGQVGVDPQTLVPLGNIAAETRQCINNIESVLVSCGLTLDHIVRIATHLADMNEQSAYNEVYSEMINAPYPTRITVGSSLGPFRIEMEAIAYVPSTRQLV